MRHRGRTDSNQKEIVGALRSVGATVEILSNVGKGCVDLLVGFRSANYLLEVKNLKGYAARKSGGITDAQKEWQQKWRGQHAIVHSVDEAMKVVGVKGEERISG